MKSTACERIEKHDALEMIDAPSSTDAEDHAVIVLENATISLRSGLKRSLA
jgi:hypothetical protein